MGCAYKKVGTTRIVPIDNSIDQSASTSLENSKLVPAVESLKDEERASVEKSTNYPITTAVNNPIQTFERKPIDDLATDYLSQRINSGTSNKRSISANSQKQEDDCHSNKCSNENTSIIEESIDKLPTITTDQVERKANDSTERSTNAENQLSKRIDSGISNKHSLSSHNNDNHSDIVSISDSSVIDETINALAATTNDHVEIVDADPEAFYDLFLKQRQEAVDKSSYRTTIESWRPNSLHQLSESIQVLSKDKALIDRHWIIFYWIACNIEYDTVSFLNHNIPAQSAESVFRTKKGVCAGYSYLYKYLCDRLGMKCESISGYAKGYGFAAREETALLKTDHAWNAVEIEQHWYLVDATWGTGHLNQQNVFKRELNCFYFLIRPHQMIYDHLPEDDKWQLLQEPIKMTQYMQMPRTHPAYFKLNVELISPRHQSHVSLVRDKSYALVLIRSPSDVELMGGLTNNDGKNGGRWETSLL